MIYESFKGLNNQTKHTKTFLLTKVKYKKLNENKKFSLNLRKHGELFLKTTFKNYRKVWLLGGKVLLKTIALYCISLEI